MTATPQPPLQAPQSPHGPSAKQERKPLSRATKVVLFVVLPLLLLATVAALLARLWPTPVHLEFQEAGADQVRVSAPQAEIEVLPSGDGEVHVEITGWSSGTEPEFSVSTAENETVIEGDCPVALLSRCSLSMSVAVPESADVRVTGTNGSITASSLLGSLDFVTTNGAVRAADTAGELNLRTINGSIELTRSASSEVNVTTTNGQVKLEFTGAPTEVVARTTNGGITVRVPEGESYFLDLRTTNGQLSTEMESERFADRTVLAEATNGSIAVEHTR
jgi:Putative adhesin